MFFGAPDVGAVPSVDFIPEIPGDEFAFVARVLSGAVVGFDFTVGALTKLQVARDVKFTYDAGTVIHEVIDDSGARYLLFNFDTESVADYELMAEGSLAGLPLPAGWSYESRTLDEEFSIRSGGLATVFSQGSLASYQQYAVPEPSSLVLMILAFVCLAWTKTWRRRGTLLGTRRIS